MTDIVERLINHADAKDVDAWMICKEAADEIERLRAALRGVIRVADRYTPEFNEARAALEVKHD